MKGEDRGIGAATSTTMGGQSTTFHMPPAKENDITPGHYAGRVVGAANENGIALGHRTGRAAGGCQAITLSADSQGRKQFHSPGRRGIRQPSRRDDEGWERRCSPSPARRSEGKVKFPDVAPPKSSYRDLVEIRATTATARAMTRCFPDLFIRIAFACLVVCR
jgi:hypothetical protein